MPPRSAEHIQRACPTHNVPSCARSLCTLFSSLAWGCTVKENEESQALDEIDAFEARLQNGGAVRQPAAKKAPPPQRKPQQQVRPTGKDYVQASKQRPTRDAAADDEKDDFDTDAKAAVRELDKFDGLQDEDD